MNKMIGIYIHNIIGHYNPTVRITTYLRTTYVVCVNFSYVNGSAYSLTSTPNNRFFKKLFHGRFICSQSFCQKSAQRKSPKKYFFFIFCVDTLPGIQTWALHLISLHTTYQRTATSEIYIQLSRILVEVFAIYLASKILNFYNNFERRKPKLQGPPNTFFLEKKNI